MGFKKIQRVPSGPGVLAEDYVKARCWGNRFELLFSEDLWVAIGKPERIGIFVGTGPDKGRLAIEPDPIGYTCHPAAPGARVRRIYVSRKKLAMEPFGSRVLDHELNGNRLTVFLKKRRRKSAPTPLPISSNDE